VVAIRTTRSVTTGDDVDTVLEATELDVAGYGTHSKVGVLELTVGVVVATDEVLTAGDIWSLSEEIG
jgi:hypothetical protein